MEDEGPVLPHVDVCGAMKVLCWSWAWKEQFAGVQYIGYDVTFTSAGPVQPHSHNAHTYQTCLPLPGTMPTRQAPACDRSPDCFVPRLLPAAQLCGFSTQQGAVLSRAVVYWFKHNDMADLERILQKVDEDARKAK